MNIKEVGAATGLPAKTIRYYEDIGLVSPNRQSNGYRVFSENDQHKLAFLARARSLGFPVESCRSLLALYDDKGRASADVKQIAKEHLTEIDRKLTELSAMRDTLGHLVEACAGDDRPDCPILKDLATPS
ncbi:Cu(I)-responsive transcriptional regulator [Sulfitobacter mediterraneus]|jgi:Cu(I)-responsive transcriptional regulator|uniref:Transcriptional regulator n=1 Tax=Sulfitobacter mediterraneus TaxID=83219 RepID=A0A061SST6_9RHOB|nr:Cu(I)-responsive transcriptional regulator [Sulfitobacter mediterraneus]KAJ03967.1 transcriptional regulator [Sulfitobacter mediterraneus]MBM1555308.1 Cu(I)-responsive transcriptional regulator [Sulfitobacter mediterraneus]MBM1567139.1 Cu(I)-responsive transcriptional regulator [Sulfitobacter mediterraneus]MBM1570941.1 Cu(I)-responsive transcriptional regulator [Sulfitobacter mediterraneus]MBM1574741.1 Cu(I)-responsive transcriptional regulator [Sulfitobacter mediterraneus]